MMSEKRFDTNGYYINDTFSDGRKWLVNEVEAKEIVDVMNNLDMKARERSKALSKLQKKVNEQQAIIEAKDSLLSILSKENEKLRFLIDINSVSERKKLERQVDEQQDTISALKDENEQLKHWNNCLAEKRHEEKEHNDNLIKKLIGKIDFLERIIEGNL